MHQYFSNLGARELNNFIIIMQVIKRMRGGFITRMRVY